MEPVTETVKVQVTPVDAPVKFGLGQIGKTTPDWATWVFRIYFYLVSFATTYIAMDATIPANTALKIIKWLAISVMAVHGFSKMLGIDSKKYEAEANGAFVPPPKQ